MKKSQNFMIKFSLAITGKKLKMLSSSITITDFPSNLPSYERLAAEDSEAIKFEVDKNYVMERQISTYFENIGLNISTILSYLSIPTLINCSHRFPEILNELHTLIEKSIYDRCNINKDIRTGIIRDGATAGTEATSYTTFLVIVGFGLLIPVGFAKIMGFVRNRPDLKILRKKLKEFHFKIRSKFFDLSKEQIQTILK